MSKHCALYSYEKCMISFYVFVSELGSWRNEDSCCLRCLVHFWLEDVIKQVTKWFVDWFDYTDFHVLWIHCICDVIVVELPVTYVVDRVIEPMSNQTNNYQGVRTRNVCQGTVIMCPSGATSLPADCCFIELALYKST